MFQQWRQYNSQRTEKSRLRKYWRFIAELLIPQLLLCFCTGWLVPLPLTLAKNLCKNVLILFTSIANAECVVWKIPRGHKTKIPPRVKLNILSIVAFRTPLLIKWFEKPQLVLGKYSTLYRIKIWQVVCIFSPCPCLHAPFHNSLKMELFILERGKKSKQVL